MATGTQLEKSPPGAPATSAPGKVDLGGKWSGLWGMARLRWAQLVPAQRRWAVASAVVLLALIVGLGWYGLRTDWRTLYVNLDPDDARQIGQILTQAQIPFQPTADGTGIRVPAPNLDKARLITAAKGTMRSGRLGFEIFDKPNWVGSEFDEQVNYQRALEGELEHTIGTLADVESARVHLVMSHDSLFRDQQRPAKASVVLKLRHRTLADGEPEAMRNLVASAVDGLTPDHVVLVDAAGNLPLGPKTPDVLRLSAEQALEDKLIATLEPVTGTGNVRASVTLEYDPNATEETDENYNPDQTVTLSMQRSEQSSGGQQVASGVPGAASNAPNTQALPVYPKETTPPQNSKSEAGTYGASKSTRHLVEAPGRIRRLTAAILVNDRLMQLATKTKAAVWQPRSTDELRNLTALAQAAVGFDPARGDMLTVQDLAFDGNRPPPPPALQDQLLATAENSPVLIKYGALLIGLLLVLFFGLRPAIRRALHPPEPKMKEHAKGEKGKELKGGKEGKDGQRQIAGATEQAEAISPPTPPPLDPEKLRQLEIFEQVKTHLLREPSHSSRLLQSWIHSD
jgi:flagellar M-ring protein FliF